MDCLEVQKFVQVYLDGEFEENDRRELEEHLRDCSACQRLADFERRFKEAIRVRLTKPTASLAFRDRLVHAMNREPLRHLFPRILVWSSVPAAAALVLLVTFTWTVTSGFAPLVEEAVERHSSAPPVEVNTSNSEEVESWFKTKVNFNVALPRFASGGFSLVGARLSHLAERQAALVRYRHDSHDYSLFVFSDPGGSLGTQRCERVASKRFCVAQKRGFSVAVWRSRGLAYSLVGDLPPRELLQTISAAFGQ